MDGFDLRSVRLPRDNRRVRNGIRVVVDKTGSGCVESQVHDVDLYGHPNPCTYYIVLVDPGYRYYVSVDYFYLLLVPSDFRR